MVTGIPVGRKGQELRVQVAALAEGLFLGSGPRGTGNRRARTQDQGQPSACSDVKTRGRKEGADCPLGGVIGPQDSTKKITFWTRTLNVNTCRTQGAKL